ncbi:DUF4124 domain-containing protein [Dokdonella sp.]|uniref:DUF4124 domain-containing protein n=1 Tax=Dokdonella sp. TaxID=2291710 RepID=UPI0031CB77B0|nr:DUF4124 domain-containing protein [Dokdonella sp.]
MKATWFLLAALALAVPAAATEMYSWTDANGVKHFSDSPPPASVKNVQKLNVRGGITSSSQVADDAPKDSASSGPAMAAAAGYSPEDIVRNCGVARQNLAALQADMPAVDDNGEPLDADAANAHAAKVEKANQQIKLFCK